MIIEKKEVVDFFIKYFVIFLFSCCKLSIYVWGGNVIVEKGGKDVDVLKGFMVIDDLSIFKVKKEFYQ